MNKNFNFILGLIIGILIMYILNEIKNNCLLSFNKQSFNKIIKVLSRQAARWSTASNQDESPLVAVLHANYGAGYLWALKDIASSEQIKAAIGIDLLTFEQNIVNIQDKATQRMIKLCPKYAPPVSYLSKIAGEG